MTFAEFIVSFAEPVGRFDPDKGCFVLSCNCAGQTGVYFFVELTDDGPRPLRPGHSGDVGGRFSGYKSWLFRTAFQDDASEQAARTIMLHGLRRREVEVRALCFTGADISDLKRLSKLIEQEVRDEFGATLELDRAAKGSWANLAQAEWRRSGRLPSDTL